MLLLLQSLSSAPCLTLYGHVLHRVCCAAQPVLHCTDFSAQHTDFAALHWTSISLHCTLHCSHHAHALMTDSARYTTDLLGPAVQHAPLL